MLKLCTIWEFTDIRESAIQELSEDKDAMGPINKIERGKSYNVNKWEMHQENPRNTYLSQLTYDLNALDQVH